MKQILCLLLVLLLLSGCAATPSRSFTPPPAATTQPTAPATEPAAEAQWSPYTGKARGYVYYYTKGRDLKWEEDVLYVAGVFLGDVFPGGHPLFNEAKTVTSFALDVYPREAVSHFNPQLREGFLAQINDLIPQIGDLKDHEIIMAVQKAVATLGDLHSDVYPLWDYMYPLWLTPFHTEEGFAFHVTYLPEKYEEHLYSELVAINGIPIQEVVERMRPYISCENEPALIDSVCTYLQCNEFLAVCGVAEYKERSTQFTLRHTDGTQSAIALDAMSQFRSLTYDYVGTDEAAAGFLTHTRPDSYYWWENLQDVDNTLYLRINQVREDYTYRYTAFTDEVLNYLKLCTAKQTVVVDFRYNPGGYFDPSLAIKLASILNMEQVEKAYVLINHASYSGAIMMPASIRQLSKKAVLVGSPGGQPANFYASSHTYTMPNSGMTFSMSDGWWCNDVNDQAPALMPDVVIYQTLPDLLDGKDTVLEAIFAGNLPQAP